MAFKLFSSGVHDEDPRRRPMNSTSRSVGNKKFGAAGGGDHTPPTEGQLQTPVALSFLYTLELISPHLSKSRPRHLIRLLTN